MYDTIVIFCHAIHNVKIILITVLDIFDKMDAKWPDLPKGTYWSSYEGLDTETLV